MSDALRRIYDHMTQEISTALASLPADALEQLAQRLTQAPRIFIGGAGRSGSAMRAFAMRLMHLDLVVYVLGETTTPGVVAGDLLLIGSGSGRTASLLAAAQKARQLHASVALLTIDPQSPIAQLAELVVPIKAPSPKATPSPDRIASIQPMGSLFEQTLLLTLDGVVVRLMELLGQQSEQMFGRHANLE